MKKIISLFKNPLFLIFLLALALRIYKLGEFPYGFHVDEVKVAWNALSILKTGLDDHGKLLPLYYNSFGDYRPAGIFYFTIPSIAVLGRSVFATRFTVALFSALTVFPIFFLTELLNKNKKRLFKKINPGHVAAFLIAISPWSIDLGRATNEVVMSTFFVVSALYFFINLLLTKDKRYCTYTAISIVLSYFLYHPIRFLGPPIFIATYLYYYKIINIQKIKKEVLICLATTIILSLFFSTTKEGLARLNQVSIFKGVDVVYEIERVKSENTTHNLFTVIYDNKGFIYLKEFVNEYARYFSGDFLIGAAGRPYRFSTPGTGLISYIELILLVVGIIEASKGKVNFLPIILLFMAPFPAAFTIEDTPNLSRAFLMLPFIIILETYGFEYIVSFSKKYKDKITIGVLALLLFNFGYFLHMYFNHSYTHKPFLKDFFVDSPTYRNVGSTDLAGKLDVFKNKYDKVIITNFPDNPYPWYAFLTNKNPKDFNKTYSPTTNERDYNNLVFSEEKCPADDDFVKYHKLNILVIEPWECPYTSQINGGSPLKITEEIKRSDGSTVYVFLERDWTKPLIVNGVEIK